MSDDESGANDGRDAAGPPPAPAGAWGRQLAEAFRTARWTLRRWTPKHIWYRTRLPLRRRRWAQENIERTRAFGKDPAARLSAGPAVAFGEFSGAHGLGRGAAYDLLALNERHASVTTVDIGPYLKGAEPTPLAFDAPFENVYFLCQPDTYGTICRLLRPDDIARAYRVGRWVWETPLFPESWRFAERLVHEVWTPSEFCAATFRAALGVPVRVVPHAVTAPPDPGIDMRARLDIPPDAFMGLAVMDIRSCPERKNPWAHVRAWKATYGDDPRRILVMKLRLGKRTRIVQNELRELIGGATNIRLLTDEMSEEEIAALHHATDLYLSLHRSEGFGLNIYEALLLGKPVVATNWSANAEYGPHFANYFGVPFRMTPYRDWTGHYADAAFEWADADPIIPAGALRAWAQKQDARTST